MNNSIKNKLLIHEVPPPEAAWERIAVELADVDLSNKILPAFANTEVAPPEGIWNKISTALDEDYFTETLSGRLASAEVNPPASAWKTIEAAINTTQEAAPVLKGKFTPVWRYAAAAVMTAVLAWGGLKLIGGSNDRDTLVVSSENADTSFTHQSSLADSSPDTENNHQNADTENGNDEARNDAALEASKRVYASVDMPRLKSRISDAANFYFASNESYNISRTADNHQTDGADETKLADRYYMMVTTEGKVIRMSKKLGHLACCISGEDHDTECVNQLKKWQEKMAKQPGTHSPGNFSDLLDLVCALEEK